MAKDIFQDGIAKQELNLIFVIDQSGSMEGERIGAVNNAIRDVMAIMPEIQDETSDAIIKVSALRFSDDAKWVNPEPKTIVDFKWKDIDANGGTDYARAYQALGKCLCKKEQGGQMPDIGGVAPIIILMSDGYPSANNWKSELAKLKKKGWFNAALKYALAIGIDDQCAIDVLAEFTGDRETVLKVYTAEALRKVIKVIAVSASKVKSQSASVSVAGGAAPTVNGAAKQQVADKLEDVQDVEW